MNAPFYPFYSLPLKLLNKGMNFPLKLASKGSEEYSKIIIFIFISFHSILFTLLKWGLRKDATSLRFLFLFLFFKNKVKILRELV